jgi:DNA polymerase-3 subunit gamma/tau
VREADAQARPPAPPWEDEPEHITAVGDAPPAEAGRAPEPAAAPAAPATEDPAALQVTALGEVWSGWVQRLLAAERVTALVRELALQSELVAQENSVWTLRVERQSLQHPGACDKLLAALHSLDAAAAPRQLQVELGAVKDTQARRISQVQAERQRLAEEVIHSDDFVQDMLTHWGARIVPGSIKPWSAAPV